MTSAGPSHHAVSRSPLLPYLASALILLAAAACRDDSPLLTSPSLDAPPASKMVACIDPSAPDCNPSPTDTHVSADVAFGVTLTSTMNESFIDPITGQWTNVLTVTPPDLQVHVEAGYTYSGAVKVSTSYSDGADPSTAIMPQIVNQDLTGDVLTDINPAGYALQTSTPDSMTAAPVMDLVGTTANGDITAGWLVSSVDTITASQSVSPLSPLAPAVASRSIASASGSPVTSASQARDQARAVSAAFVRASRGTPTTAIMNRAPVTIRGIGVDQIEVVDAPLPLDGGTPPQTPALGASGSLRSAAAGTSAPASASETHTRRYKKDRDHWVITEDRSESDTQNDHGKQHAAHVIHYRNVKWFVNAQRDSLRRAARPTTEWIPRTSPGNVLTPASPGLLSEGASANRIAAPSTATRLVACGDECASGSVTPSGPQPLGYGLPCMMDVAGTINDANATINLLYQHGFKSDATTWCQMSDYMRAKFMVGHEIRHTTTWYKSYEDQAVDLEGRFRGDAASYPGPYVLVGHSNGGLVNRYMAQTISDPSLVAGVVTISSPHAGAYLANFDQAVLTAAVTIPFVARSFGCDVADTYVCNRTGALAAELITVLAPILLTNAVPVTQEMGTNAQFHNTINARGDAAYRVAGVQNRIWDRWTLWRIIGDAHVCQPQAYIPCDDYSRRYVNAVDKTYHHYIDCAVISGLLGLFWHPSLAVAIGCAKNAGSLRAIDYAYKRMSVANDHGDGVVPEHSQMYPGAPSSLQILVDDSDSHIGETKSRRTADGLGIAINRAIGTPFAQ